MAGHFLERPGQAVGVVDWGENLFGLLGAEDHFIAQQCGFDGAEAAQTPAGGGHGLHQFHFDAAGGGKLGDVGVEQELEFRAGFMGKDHGFGCEPVAQAVAGRTGAAFRGGRAAGFWARGFGTGRGNDYEIR